MSTNTVQITRLQDTVRKLAADNRALSGVLEKERKRASAQAHALTVLQGRSPGLGPGSASAAAAATAAAQAAAAAAQAAAATASAKPVTPRADSSMSPAHDHSQPPDDTRVAGGSGGGGEGAAPATPTTQPQAAQRQHIEEQQQQQTQPPTQPPVRWLSSGIATLKPTSAVVVRRTTMPPMHATAARLGTGAVSPDSLDGSESEEEVGGGHRHPEMTTPSKSAEATGSPRQPSPHHLAPPSASGSAASAATSPSQVQARGIALVNGVARSSGSSPLDAVVVVSQLSYTQHRVGAVRNWRRALAEATAATSSSSGVGRGLKGSGDTGLEHAPGATWHILGGDLV